MRAVRSFGIAGLCLAGLCGCADVAPRVPAYYVVRPQDTLYSIAWRQSLDYRDLAAWNHLGPDLRIEVGQRLALRPVATAGGIPARRAGSRAPRAAQPPARSSSGPAESAESQREIASLHWVWPTERIGSPRRLPNGGLVIAGKLGQDVRAAAAGRVVYTGSGIRGFGELVIIKHSETLLSAYAYNHAVLVRDDEAVAAGQAIARMGEDARRTPALYFEIRLNGHTIDPLPYLPGPK